MNRLLRAWVGIGALVAAGCQTAPQASAGSAAAVKQMQVNGVNLAYQEQGRGVPVVFVHGCCADLRAWERQREIFAPGHRFISFDDTFGREGDAVAQGHRFIRFDQRYFGPAPWPDNGEKFSGETQIEDLAAFVRGLGSGPVHLVGWSMSGTSVLGVAVRHPQLVRSVFVFEPALSTMVSDPADVKAIADDRGAMFGAVVATVKAGDHAAAMRMAMDNVNGQPGTFEALPADFKAMQMDNARTLPVMFAAAPPPRITCEQLGQIKAPTTIVRGELTRPSFRIVADTANRCIPASKLIVVPGGRHLWPAQHPGAFNDTLLAFLTAQ